MIVSCPHCGKQLKLSDKFKASLEQLKPGQKAKVKCNQCNEPFGIDPTPGIAGKAAPPRVPTPKKSQVKPPGPPDITWIKEGVFEGQDVVEEIPLALVLMPEGEGRDEVVKAVEGLGYRAEIATSSATAVEKMEFINYSSVILHTEFEEGGMERGKFHAFMSAMAMNKRRYVFYILIGKELHTLYDLEALAYSANIVVNEAEVKHFGTILRKAIPDYEALFGPLMEELRVLGK